ncbi:MAG: hypothetical protein K6L80_09985 [Agarilytica sp.]
MSVISVIFGGVLLSAVVFKYLQREGVANVPLTCFLTLFGFALVASPAWTNISWKSKDIELQLVRETTRQMNDYVRILNGYDNLSRRDLDWEPDSPQNIRFASLANDLRSQKIKIEAVLSEGNMEQIIKETKLGTELIENIANAIDAS